MGRGFCTYLLILRISSLRSSGHRLARTWAKKIAADVGGEWTRHSYSEERVDVIADNFTIEIKVRQNIPEYVKEAILLDKTIDASVPEYLKGWIGQARRYAEKYQKPCFICWCEKGHGLEDVIVIANQCVPFSVQWGDVFVYRYRGSDE